MMIVVVILAASVFNELVSSFLFGCFFLILRGVRGLLVNFSVFVCFILGFLYSSNLKQLSSHYIYIWWVKPFYNKSQVTANVYIQVIKMRFKIPVLIDCYLQQHEQGTTVTQCSTKMTYRLAPKVPRMHLVLALF